MSYNKKHAHSGGQPAPIVRNNDWWVLHNTRFRFNASSNHGFINENEVREVYGWIKSAVHALQGRDEPFHVRAFSSEYLSGNEQFYVEVNGRKREVTIAPIDGRQARVKDPSRIKNYRPYNIKN